MRILCALAVVAALACALAAPVRGQPAEPEPRPPLTLPAALERAARDNPGAAATARAVDAARGALLQAGLRPNPQVELETEIENLQRVESAGILISQELESGGKRPARLRVAEAALLEAARQREDALRRLRLDVTEGFARLLFAQAALDVRRDALDLVRRQVDLTRRRVQLGDAAGIEVIQLETEAARREAALLTAEGARRAATATLAPLLALPPDPDLRVEGTHASDELVPPLAALIERATATRPDLQAAAARTRQREADVALQRALSVPNVTVGAGVSRVRTFIDGDAVRPPGVVNGIDDRDWVIGLRVQFPLAVNNRNQGNVQRAAAQAEEARLREEALRQAVRGQVAEAYERLLAARAARIQLAQSAVPGALRALETIERAYQLGARGILDVLAAREAYVQARLEALEAARDEALARAALEAAVGAPPDGTEGQP